MQSNIGAAVSRTRKSKIVGAREQNVLRLQNMRIKVLPIHIFTCLLPADAQAQADVCTIAGSVIARARAGTLHNAYPQS